MQNELGYRPLVYFWIAEFSDNTALAQFDPETGGENKADPDWLPSVQGQPQIKKDKIWISKKICRFGWYPFSLEFAEKIHRATGQIVIPSGNPAFVLGFNDGERLVAYRTNTVRYMFLREDVQGRETTYVLGKAEGMVWRIREDGSVEKW